MSLFDSASLVVTPNGIKEDKLYAIKPTDGSGDLVVTRATTATRVNSAGLIEVTPYNFLQRSEEFNNAIWNKTSVGGASIPVVTANSTTAPNGTLTADKIVFNAPASGDISVLDQSISLTGTATGSFYIKAFSSTDIGKIIGFRFSSGSYSLVTLTDSWQRVSVTATALTTFDIHLRPAIGTSSGTVSIYLWGAQLVSGTSAKEYFPTTDRLDVPRLDYTNSSCPSILVEPQRTNLATYSEQFDNADWAKQNTTISANNTTSPSGIQNADKLIANITNDRHLIYQAFGVVANTYTFTTYAKAGENSFLIMRLDTDSPEVKTWFNLSNGTIGTSEGGSPTITSIGNGWYRCSVQFVSSTTQTIYGVLYTAKINGSTNFAGNGTDGTYIWGAQLEAGSYATSYIPTQASSVTRNADVISKTGISSLIGQTEGTIFLEADIQKRNESEFYIAISNGYSLGEAIYLNQPSSGALNILFRTSGLNPTISVSSANWNIGLNKIAIAYNSTLGEVFINGVSKGTVTLTAIPTCNQIALASRSDSPGGLVGAGAYKQAILFKTRLSNTELAQLTTI